MIHIPDFPIIRTNIDPETGIVTHNQAQIGKVVKQHHFYAFICPATRWYSQALYHTPQHAASALINHLEHDRAKERAQQSAQTTESDSEPMATFVNPYGRRSEIRSAGRRMVRRRFARRDDAG